MWTGETWLNGRRSIKSVIRKTFSHFLGTLPIQEKQILIYIFHSLHMNPTTYEFATTAGEMWTGETWLSGRRSIQSVTRKTFSHFLSRLPIQGNTNIIVYLFTLYIWICYDCETNVNRRNTQLITFSRKEHNDYYILIHLCNHPCASSHICTL